MSRGVLQPDGRISMNNFDPSLTPAEAKLSEQYFLSNQSSYLNPGTAEIDNAVAQLNREWLAEDFDKKQQEHLDGSAWSIAMSNKLSGFEGNSKYDYKKEILGIFKDIEDPFRIEIGGETFDYEQNPSDPSNPQKQVSINEIKEVKWE